MVSGIPGFVKLLAFAPVYSPKLPLATVGTSPEIKLLEAAAQVGVRGTAPVWFVPVTVSCDQAELIMEKRANDARLAAIWHLNRFWGFIMNLRGCWMMPPNFYANQMKVHATDNPASRQDCCGVLEAI